MYKRQRGCRGCSVSSPLCFPSPCLCAPLSPALASKSAYTTLTPCIVHVPIHCQVVRPRQSRWALAKLATFRAHHVSSLHLYILHNLSALPRPVRYRHASAAQQWPAPARRTDLHSHSACQPVPLSTTRDMKRYSTLEWRATCSSRLMCILSKYRLL